MQRIEGKYNSAEVMIDSIDATTEAQIHSFLECPALAGAPIAIMPDCHAGAGAVIGFTQQLGEFIIPNIVGVDIGCGMTSICIGSTPPCTLRELDAVVKRVVPAGFNIHANAAQAYISAEMHDELRDWCGLIGCDFQRALCSLGTLGGGNHFLELGRDGNGQFWLTVHSGSRNFGLKVAQYFQSLAEKERGPLWPHKGLAYLEKGSLAAYSYLKAQRFACEYAAANRDLVLRNVMDAAGLAWNGERVESVHNYIDAGGMIRKGATDASEGTNLLIPFNMRDGIALCRGKGNTAWNNSAPHGAGRILSRSQAKKRLDAEGFAARMKAAGVYTTTATEETLDEAPEAYKNTATILEAIKDTAEVLTLIKPVYNFKAGGE